MPQAEKPDSTTTSRRRFLAATAATAAAASVAATATRPALATAACGDENPALVALGAEFDRLVQIERDAWNAMPDDEPDSSWKVAEMAHEAVAKVVDQIALVPSSTLDGLRLKARLVAWCHGAVDEPVHYA